MATKKRKADKVRRKPKKVNSKPFRSMEKIQEKYFPDDVGKVCLHCNQPFPKNKVLYDTEEYPQIKLNDSTVCAIPNSEGKIVYRIIGYSLAKYWELKIIKKGSWKECADYMQKHNLK